MSKWKFRVIAATVPVVLFLLLAEFAYRIKIHRIEQAKHKQPTYSATSSLYRQFDEVHGEKFLPNSEFKITFIDKGRVVFGSVVSRSNVDGLGGKTTIAQYDAADFKILLFGDSFTHWNQQGVTWSDLLGDHLNGLSDKSVALLNYGRGSYGVLQMLGLAAEKVAQHKPDLVIFAMVGDDFTRARWWYKTIQWRGFQRGMITSRKGVFTDYRYAVDSTLINSRATLQWCETALASNNPEDPVLTELNQQYSRLRQEVDRVRGGFQLFNPRTSYLWRRIRNGHPYNYLGGALPRISMFTYSEDLQAVQDCETLTQFGVRLKLIYLPIHPEILAGEPYISPQSRRLLASLEELLGQKYVYLYDWMDDVGSIGKIDMLPYDGHPNYDGLALYAKTIFKYFKADGFPYSLVSN